MVEVSPEIIEKIGRYVDRYFAVHKANTSCVIKQALSEEYYDSQIKTLLKFTNSNYQNKRLLEIGSGFGMFLSLAKQKYNLCCYGIEPNLELHKISLDVLRCFGIEDSIISLGVGESLPFPDEKFDFVYSANVLEHTTFPEKVFSEALRVLKKRGILQFVVPNFNSFFEGHYGIFWIPGIYGKLAKLYVRLWGRDASYIDTLFFVTYKKVHELLERNKEKIRVLDLGKEAFKERLRKMDYPEWKDRGRLKRILRFLNKIRACELVGEIATRFKIYTPIIITIEKKQ